jgi:hypothetical protein
MRRGRWLSARVSEVNLRNPALNLSKSLQFSAIHHLAQWDENHAGENVDRPSVWAQSECDTLQQENQAYTGNNHHDEDMGHN